ncbi:RICIN domain-containing protein [Nocardia sp. NPDC049526]|uniref:RICIN domain-containing protein n=1 Tax=Nocardia sp. NPDC049526 TaxID=3364316 RepID=UPI0037A1F091
MAELTDRTYQIIFRDSGDAMALSANRVNVSLQPSKDNDARQQWTVQKEGRDKFLVISKETGAQLAAPAIYEGSVPLCQDRPDGDNFLWRIDGDADQGTDITVFNKDIMNILIWQAGGQILVGPWEDPFLGFWRFQPV